MNFEASFVRQEAQTHPRNRKILLISLFGLFTIAGILMAIFYPEAEFTWFFGSIPYFLGLFLFALGSLMFFFGCLREYRNTKYFFTEDGKLDLSTPRAYSELKRPKLIALFNRGGLDEFAYDGEGNVYLKTSKGKTLTAPLSDLTVKYQMDKAGRNDWRIYKMTVTDPEGNKIKFTTGSTMLPFPSLEDEEYDDIHMILSTAGTLKESKISKASKWADKIKGLGDDFDFSDIAYSVADAAVSVAKDGSDYIKNRKTATDNQVIDFVKAKIFTEEKEKKKKSWFKKVMEYFWMTVLCLYLLAVLVVNIIALPEIFGWSGDKDKNEDQIENSEYIESVENATDNLSPKAEFLENASEYYICEFTSGGQFYLSLVPETGSGVYQSPSGNIYFLSVDSENDNRTWFQCSAATENGEPTKIAFNINMIDDYSSINGTMTGTDGSTTFNFKGQLVSDSEYGNSTGSQSYEQTHLTGIIDGKYKIDMTLNVEDRSGTYYYTKNGADNTLDLEITEIDNDGKIIMIETNDKGEHTGTFEGHISDNEIRGWYTNYKGKEMPFYLEVN